MNEKGSKDDDWGKTRKHVAGSVEAVGKKVPTLVIIHGRSVGDSFILNKPSITVGRIPGNDIEINDSMVSRRHVRILKEAGDTYTVIDLKTTNGTHVNDQPVKEAVLSDGDRIRIGETVLRFSFQDAVDLMYMDEMMALIHLDNLTGLLRKRTFDYELDNILFNYREKGEPVSVTMMDLDFFKNVNDTYGHTTGSYVISQVGELIRKKISEQGVAGRFGGEEFIAFFPGCDREKAWVICNRLRKELEQRTFAYEGAVINITMSMGISEFPRDGSDPKTLIKKADKALYDAKNNGRNRVCIYGMEEAHKGK